MTTQQIFVNHENEQQPRDWTRLPWIAIAQGRSKASAQVPPRRHQHRNGVLARAMHRLYVSVTGRYEPEREIAVTTAIRHTVERPVSGIEPSELPTWPYPPMGML